MSLTANDLNEIRSIVESSLTKQSNEVIKTIQDEIVALRNDVKDITTKLRTSTGGLASWYRLTEIGSS